MHKITNKIYVAEIKFSSFLNDIWLKKISTKFRRVLKQCSVFYLRYIFDIINHKNTINIIYLFYRSLLANKRFVKIFARLPCSTRGIFGDQFYRLRFIFRFTFRFESETGSIVVYKIWPNCSVSFHVINVITKVIHLQTIEHLTKLLYSKF
jgi:hypothetical protein